MDEHHPCRSYFQRRQQSGVPGGGEGEGLKADRHVYINIHMKSSSNSQLALCSRVETLREFDWHLCSAWLDLSLHCTDSLSPSHPPTLGISTQRPTERWKEIKRMDWKEKEEKNEVSFFLAGISRSKNTGEALKRHFLPRWSLDGTARKSSYWSKLTFHLHGDNKIKDFKMSGRPESWFIVNIFYDINLNSGILVLLGKKKKRDKPK